MYTNFEAYSVYENSYNFEKSIDLSINELNRSK